MEGIFPQSKELKHIIENHGWCLYDMTNQPEGRPYSWDEINRMSPAEQFEVDHNYMFIPSPKRAPNIKGCVYCYKGVRTIDSHRCSQR